MQTVKVFNSQITEGALAYYINLRRFNTVCINNFSVWREQPNFERGECGTTQKIIE